MIPLVDLKGQYKTVAQDIAAGLSRVFETTSFVLGSEVAVFEEAYARFSGVAHCVGVGNGTDALELALRALGIGRGDEVILPANTFIACPLAVVRAGATPVLVDCDPKKLHDDDIGAGVHYPVPIHLQGAFAHLGHLRGAFPVTERAAEEILSLPLFPEITAEQQECVTAALRRALA